ncbi:MULTISPECIES: rhodanese-like domain-containing protein [unclassified Exiguobacterium]|jgi:rhodanese-related sulfurtransferase|uniref:rhodanese-like domain-containing protein n=1 Tax=unclassified Exiguobacterium TaxID=2644629 RepID=UPI00103A399D|nr:MULTISPECIES: rhodanese-like domain-containing protein [unclassified Exiguobacterium]TCI22052.1 rhodanese-like domain-containing protein [Exiguobacterium sp. SL-9]TCI29529.1 rhodanese-like domain-containing protein [Exiguobacterium sp. SL-10]
MGIETILVIILWAALIAYIVWRFLPARGLKKMKQEEFRASLRKGQLIDVREPNEYKGGHIVGARNIPVGQLKLRMKELRKDQPILMYCQGKSRSNQAAKLLMKNGYTDIYMLDGGFKNWKGKVKKG